MYISLTKKAQLLLWQSTRNSTDLTSSLSLGSIYCRPIRANIPPHADLWSNTGPFFKYIFKYIYYCYPHKP